MRGGFRIALVVVTGLTSCARAPEALSPSTTYDYAGWDCNQLRNEKAVVDEALAIAIARHRLALKQDTYGMVIAGFPLGTMTGKNLTIEIADIKGRLAALKKSILSCPSPVDGV